MAARLPARNRWGRMLSEEAAAEYLSLSQSTLRTLGIETYKVGRRVLYDRVKLDRWADRITGRAPAPEEMPDAQAEEERRFFAARGGRGRH